MRTCRSHVDDVGELLTHHDMTTPPRNRPAGHPRRAGRCAVGHPHAAGDGELPAGRPAGASRGWSMPSARSSWPRRGPITSWAGGTTPKFAAIEAACQEMIDGRLDEHVVVDALQGGAGTSTNMNVNEVLANRALQLLGRPLGDYARRQPARRRQPAPIDQRHLSHGAAGGGHLRPARAGAQGGRAAGGVSGRRRSSSPTWSRSAGPNCRTPC